MSEENTADAGEMPTNETEQTNEPEQPVESAVQSEDAPIQKSTGNVTSQEINVEELIAAKVDSLSKPRRG